MAIEGHDVHLAVATSRLWVKLLLLLRHLLLLLLSRLVGLVGFRLTGLRHLERICLGLRCHASVGVRGVLRSKLLRLLLVEVLLQGLLGLLLVLRLLLLLL